MFLSVQTDILIRERNHLQEDFLCTSAIATLHFQTLVARECFPFVVTSICSCWFFFFLLLNLIGMEEGYKCLWNDIWRGGNNGGCCGLFQIDESNVQNTK